MIDRRPAIGTVRLPAALAIAALYLACGCSRPSDPADLVLLGGKIVTMDPDVPLAPALAVRGDKIVGIGSDREIETRIGRETKVVRLEGHLAIPGFIESHGHLMSLGILRMNLDLSGARTWDDVVEMVKGSAARAKSGQWIYGRGWHQEKWSTPPRPEVEGYPVHDALSAASPDNPVVLRHASGHAALANSRALDAAGIGPGSPDPAGGRVLRDASGRPTGVLIETAGDAMIETMEKARALRPREDTEAEDRRAVELAQDECLRKGVTTFHDAGASFERIALYRKLAEEGRLKLRLWVMAAAKNDELARRLPEVRTVGFANGHLTVRAIKKVMDGALGSRGAWMIEPYSDDPSRSGLVVDPVAEIEEAARIALETDAQLCVHAIGDRANREVLDLYERAFAASARGRGLRWRVEHAQHLDPAEIPRFAKLGVIAAMQGIHCVSDGPWVAARIGPARAERGAYVWRKLLVSGAVIANGTDTPVEDVNPIASFHASVTRRLADGTQFHREQRMRRDEALRSYTWAGAYAGFEEDRLGSLAPGKYADIVVLSRDLMTAPDDEIPGTEVLYTIVGGRVLYRK